MAEVRRAFLLASIGRYLVMAINLATTLVLARLLAPAAFGVSVLGAAVFAVAEALRALGGGAFLIQRKQLDHSHIRTSFTVSLLVTLAVAGSLLSLAEPLTRYFDAPELARYLLLLIPGYLTGPFVYAISALLSRQMSFGRIAAVGIATASVNGAVSILLAALGFSYLSLAWASSLSSICGMIALLHWWRDWSIFRPMLREWRSVIAFGAYDSATAVLSQIGETLPYLILARLLNVEAVGLGQRAVVLCMFPERVILAGVGAVALPAFSQQLREGRSLKRDYLRAVELITAAQWPCLILLVLLAHPIVALLLGSLWGEVVPIVQLLGTALLFSFPMALHYPTLVALGAIRYMPPVIVVQSILSLSLLTFAARGGLYEAAASTLVIVPFNGIIALVLARHFVRFGWLDVVNCLRKSAVCTLGSAAGPIAVILAWNRGLDLPIAGAALAIALSAAGWLAVLRLTRHPLVDEMLQATSELRKAAGKARLAIRDMRQGSRMPPDA